MLLSRVCPLGYSQRLGLPKQIAGIDGVTQISGTGDHICALLGADSSVGPDGSVWCWGEIMQDSWIDALARRIRAEAAGRGLTSMRRPVCSTSTTKRAAPNSLQPWTSN